MTTPYDRESWPEGDKVHRPHCWHAIHGSAKHPIAKHFHYEDALLWCCKCGRVTE